MAANRSAPSSDRSRGGEPGSLGLDGDRRDVVGDDVVQLAGDPRALGEQRLFAERHGMSGDAGIAFLDHGAVAAQQQSEAERSDGDDEHEEASRTGVVPVVGRGGIDEEGQGEHHRIRDV